MNEDLLEPYQSAYRAGHSTETALNAVHNFITTKLDDDHYVLLVLLDLSSAFDTVNHEILLERLQSRYGLRGTVLSWFTSYITDRYQKVKIGDRLSPPRHLCTGVPQGSVLGPVLFSLYIAELSDVIRQHGVHFHHYADDTQLLLSFDKDDTQHAFGRMETCIADVNKWLTTHQLKLNCDKTEFIVFHSRFSNITPVFPSLSVGSDTVNISTTVRDLGAFFDRTMSLEHHVLTLCRSANWQLRRISRLRKYLDNKTCEILVHAFVTSKLDFLNSLLIGLPDTILHKLQKIQNTAARIVRGKGRKFHATPLLKDLHWLPISYRIKYKILLLAFRAHRMDEPVYLSNCISPYIPTRNLRSSGQSYLTIPKPRLKTYGYRSFEYTAASLWNQLPDNILTCTELSTFKCSLKTYFFSCCYGE